MGANTVILEHYLVNNSELCNEVEVGSDLSYFCIAHLTKITAMIKNYN